MTTFKVALILGSKKRAQVSITKLPDYKITQFPNSLLNAMDLQKLMSQAQQQYESLQKKMQETVVEGSAGGGSVTVKMDGAKHLLSLKIDPEAVKSGDVEMLQDLVVAAINEASRKVDETMKSTVGGMLGGLGMGL
jgi:DNA-binding YbaB/EbfC family protein